MKMSLYLCYAFISTNLKLCFVLKFDYQFIRNNIIKILLKCIELILCFYIKMIFLLWNMFLKFAIIKLISNHSFYTMLFYTK